MTLIFGILYSFVKPFYIVERIVPFSTRVSVHKLAAYADAGFLFKPGYMERGLKFRIWNVREYHLVRIGQRVKCPQTSRSVIMIKSLSHRILSQRRFHAASASASEA